MGPETAMSLSLACPCFEGVPLLKKICHTYAAILSPAAAKIPGFWTVANVCLTKLSLQLHYHSCCTNAQQRQTGAPTKVVPPVRPATGNLQQPLSMIQALHKLSPTHLASRRKITPALQVCTKYLPSQLKNYGEIEPILGSLGLFGASNISRATRGPRGVGEPVLHELDLVLESLGSP